MKQSNLFQPTIPPPPAHFGPIDRLAYEDGWDSFFDEPIEAKPFDEVPWQADLVEESDPAAAIASFRLGYETALRIWTEQECRAS